MIELRHLDAHHFEIEEGCHRLHSQMCCLGAIICDINAIGFLKWTSNVKRRNDSAHSHIG